MTDFLKTAVSGVNAANSRLGIVSGNLANAQTTGYKSQSGEFKAMFSGEESIGVSMRGVKTNYSNGNISQTGNDLNHAIVGNGMFVVKDSDGNESYTRAGFFDFGADGYLKDSNGNKVQGFASQDSKGVVGDIFLNKSPMEPVASTSGSIAVNLGSAKDKTTTLTTTLSVFDNLGHEHKLNVVFSNRVLDPVTGEVKWDMKGKFDGAPLALPATKIGIDANGKMKLNEAPFVNGKLSVDLSLVKPTISGVSTMSIDFSKTTGFDSQTTIRSQKSDGSASGNFSKFIVGDDGVITSYFDNGQTRTNGQIAIASFANYNGLKEGNNGYFELTNDAGEKRLGLSGDAGFGQLIKGSVENSNVNSTEQLVELIDAQRAFQQCSKVIGASKTISNALLQSI
ncbi:flagellar hook protein FlgE [Photobacterium kishitanii]|uniref:Flagellar hook protein FlgE n=1 Tax=Photobacterium kishitanii TaxID=318456 RepID=A0A2T3KMU2_9GAMM|nr:flagellar hook-basal body complex protein [Photobacterium kishitanii]PSV01120.1 hypothetical protein C9J27_03615 [Photobacterium kishitanii]